MYMLVLTDIKNELQEMVDDIGNFTVKVDSPSEGISIIFDTMNIDIKPERNKGYLFDQNTCKWIGFKNKPMYFIYKIIVDNYIDIKMKQA